MKQAFSLRFVANVYPRRCESVEALPRRRGRKPTLPPSHEGSHISSERIKSHRLLVCDEPRWAR